MCEAIDIVAGSLTCERRVADAGTESRANFITDGARIYLTERGDIQHYFAIGNRTEAVNISSKMKSGIGIKADHTLVLGRERVLIIAGPAHAEGGDRTAGLNKNITPRIEIGSTADSGAQPAVIGDGLVGYLMEIKDEMQELRNDIQELEDSLTRYKTALALHTHTGGGIGVVQVAPSPEGITEGIQSIPKFFKTTISNIRKTFNSMQKDWKRTGTRDGTLQGTIEDRILSSTVYIGK